MSYRMAKCPDRHLCGATGHRTVEGKVVRCPCREEDERERILGPMYSDQIVETTALSQKMDTDLVIEGTLTGVRKHISRCLLELRDVQKHWLTMDAYRLIEIFLGEDSQFTNQYAAIDPDLLVLLLGFADPPNKYLPELVMQTLARRELIRKPTWVVMGIPLKFVSNKYSTALEERLEQFHKVEIK